MRVSQYKQALIDSKHLIKEVSPLLLEPAQESGYYEAENGFWYYVTLRDSQPVVGSIGRSAELYNAELAAAEGFGIDGDNSSAEFERYYKFVLEKLELEPALPETSRPENALAKPVRIEKCKSNIDDSQR